MMSRWRRLLPPSKKKPLALGLAAAVLAGLLLLLVLVPRQASLPDFAAIGDVQQMKRAFAGFLSPIVAEQNAALLEVRRDLQRMHTQLKAGESLGFFDRRTVNKLAAQFEVDRQASQQAILDELLTRVDVVPPALVLAQAAKESGWGRSRFAVEGNNLFGQWCYVKGCGIVPKQRPPGAQHEVARFDSPSQAVDRYLQNLNSHESYEGLRRLRQQMRDAGKDLDPIKLANGLLLYSERREAYVEEVKSMVRQFQRLADTT